MWLALFIAAIALACIFVILGKIQGAKNECKSANHDYEFVGYTQTDQSVELWECTKCHKKSLFGLGLANRRYTFDE
jgi:hypothetical protein